MSRRTESRMIVVSVGAKRTTYATFGWPFSWYNQCTIHADVPRTREPTRNSRPTKLGAFDGIKILVTNAILMSLGIISAWVLHVIHWLASRRPGPGRVMCPRCGRVCVETPGDIKCSRCSTVFAVKA
jgi:hypothetical protein